jgi:NAD(P)-dependent dehydrogenase (short-subunit alcohol dehydrogenase family)
MVEEARPLPGGAGELPAGRYLVAGGAAALAKAVATGIAEAGGTPVVRPLADAAAAEGPFAGLVHLGATEVGAADLADPAGWQAALEAAEKSAYRIAAAHADSLATGRLVLASALGGRFARDGGPLRVAGGAPGLAKSLREEWPEARPKAVDLDPAEPAEAQAAHLLAELAAGAGRLEVGYPAGTRRIFRSVAAPLPEAAALDLGAAPVILATGGARGITAECLMPFAAPGATLVLVGRSPLPEPEEAATRGFDAAALRGHFAAAARAAGEKVTPVEIGRRIDRLLQNREIAANLADMRAGGATVEYRRADMGEAGSVAALVAGVLADHGRIDGVIHGAGVIEDRRIADKTPDSWGRVVGPKVTGMLALAAALEGTRPRFFAAFASVAGRYGNSGQTDYAAANEVMNRLAGELQARWPETRVVAVNWGPWDATTHGAGMVSDAVRAKFEAQGVTLVNAKGGAQAFRDEILRGPRGDSAVVLGAGPWERHEAERGGMPETASEAGPETGPEVAPDTLAPGKWPLLPQTAQSAAPRGGTQILRPLSLATDPWIGEHRIGGVPVLPMAVAAELCAEAAAEIWPDWQVVGLSDLRALSGLRMEGDADLRLALVGFGAEHADADGFSARMEIRGTDKIPRAHYRASLRMAPPGLAPDLDPQRALAEEILAHHARPSTLSARGAYRDLLFHGPAYQRMKLLEGLDGGGLTAAVAPSAPGSFGPGGWLFDPGLLDTAAQLAWVWSTEIRGAPALPNAIQRATILAEGRAARMVYRLREGIEAPQVLADVAIADADGTPLLLIEGLESTSDKGLRRFAGWTGEILDDIPRLHGERAAE